jgi:hypothetical protein
MLQTKSSGIQNGEAVQTLTQSREALVSFKRVYRLDELWGWDAKKSK